MFEVGWGGLDSVWGRVSLLFLLNKYVQKGLKKSLKMFEVRKRFVINLFFIVSTCRHVHICTHYYFSKFTFLYTFLVYSYINIL